MSKAWKKLKKMYEVLVAMTKYKSTSFSLHPAAIFHTFLPQFSKLFTLFVETPFLTEGVQRVAKAMTES